MKPCLARSQTRAPAARGQAGVVMFVAIVVLLLMTLAGIAMLRQMRSGASIAGNLAFKQSATAAADLGIEAARAWIMPRAAGVLMTHDNSTGSASNGYFSNYSDLPGEVEPQNLPWDKAHRVPGEDAAGNEVRYLIHRLCKKPDLLPNAPGQECVMAPTVSGSKVAASYASTPLGTPAQPYFRVTVRVTGPRNSLSYVQSIVY